MRVRLFYKLSAMILLTIAFVSCSDSNKEDIEPNVPTEFTPSNESTIYFASGAEFAGNGGELTISFTCNKKWEATSTKDWCKIMPQGGEAGLNSLQVNVDANSTLENRDAVITIIVGELSKYITIRQSASTTGKVHVENAGSLLELLKCDVSKIEELTISGYLNGTDFKLLREMSNNLIKLDLSEAHIVEGGESYFSDANQKHYTKNAIFPIWGLGGFLELQEIKLPHTINKIDSYAFLGCYELKAIEIPQNVYDLGDCVFMSCTSLKDILLPNTLKYIPMQAFYGCNMKEIVLPEQLDSIGMCAFYNCKELEEVKINDGLRVIDDCAFSGCLSLKKIEIPQSVNYVGYNTFDGCLGLEELTLYKNIEDCTGIFGNLYSSKGCGIKKLNLFFKELNEGFLNGCFELESLILNEGLEIIHDYSLEDAPKLKELTLPSTIKEIEQHALSNNPLEKLHLTSKTPPQMYLSYEEYYNRCILYVPNGSKKVYINVGEPWTLFKDIIEE